MSPPAVEPMALTPAAPQAPSSAGGDAAPLVPPTLTLDGATLLGPGDAGEPPQVASPGGERSTASIVDALARLHLSPEAEARLFAPFPLAGPASYRDGGTDGTDIATVAGTPVVASSPGTVSIDASTLTLRTPDGTTITYRGAVAASGLRNGSTVTEGTILGQVSDTAAPVLRFELRPRGGAAIDPVPLLDRWLAQARQTAQALAGPIASKSAPSRSPGSQSSLATLAGAARRLADPAGVPSSPIPAVVVIGLAAAWLVRRRRRALAAVLGPDHRDGGGRGATRTFDRQ